MLPVIWASTRRRVTGYQIEPLSPSPEDLSSPIKPFICIFNQLPPLMRCSRSGATHVLGEKLPSGTLLFILCSQGFLLHVQKTLTLKFVKQTDTNLLLHFILFSFFLNKSCWFLMGSQVMCLGLIIYDDA